MDSTTPLGRPARSSRSPLYDVTNRLNSESLQHLHDQIKRKSYRAPEVAAVLGEGPASFDERDAALRRSPMMSSHNNRGSLARDQPIPEDVAMTAEDLQGSAADGPDSSIVFNSRSSAGQKTHIGPWKLGKTLGKGSTGMVRICRHRVSREWAAVKIVSKNSRKIVQAGSIYGLDRWDNKLPENINGEMRIPIAIEREVAILKLIQHPNIMKLYDIWENRREIYLVLEYVDHGDLFSYITRHGRLAEEGAMHFYRQIMSALSYCHAFNICHRDLKPENILLTSENHVKIADFSMAALHQTSAHRLHTACGSPHYAAPELLSGKKYRGDKADIWSMGVILYAMLASCLPFDDPDLTFMMELVKKGEYDMPEFLSLEAKDLLRRILQVNPDRRISMKEMWRHPLVQKYDYMDDYQPENKHPTDIRKEFKHRPFRADEIDPQLVRQLRSLWHMFTEDELKVALMSHEANEQKMFYWLLQRYRERQLENFNPEIVHSRSDYHHLKPSSGWKERRTTCEFANPEGRFGRSVSRFTVISNVAESEDTAPSYDPCRQSNPPAQPRDSQASSTRVTIHRQKSNRSRKDGRPASHDAKQNRFSTKSAPESARRPKPKPVARLSSIQGTASSLNSIPSRNSRQGNQYVRNVKLRRKRKVDFSQIRAPKALRQDQDQQDSPRWDVRGGSVYVETNPGVPRPDSGVLPIKESRASNKPIRKKPCAPRIDKHRGSEAMSNEELRNFSSSLAQDCDAAFGTSLMAEPSVGASILDIGHESQKSSPLALRFPSSPLLDQLGYPSPPSDCEEWLNRPLPPLPLSAGAHTPPSTVPDPRDSGSFKQDSKRESGESENQKQGRIVSQFNRLSMPILSSKEDRRIASAPAAPAHEKRLASMFSSRGGKRGAIMVALDEQDRGRIVSYPVECVRPPAEEEHNGRDDMNRVGYTIQVADSSQRPQTSVYAGRQSNYLDAGTQEQQRPQTSGYTGHQSTHLGVSGREQQRLHTSAYAGRRSVHLDDGSQQQPRPQSNAFAGPQSTHTEAGTRERVSLPQHKKTASTSSSGSGVSRSVTKKKSSWFLNKKQETADNGSASAQVPKESAEAQTQTQPQNMSVPAADKEAPRSNWSDSTDPPSPTPRKKRKFGLLFWKSKPDTKMSLAGPEYGDSPTIAPRAEEVENAKRQSQASCGVEETVGQRNIVTHHNWLARLFRVKPATEHLCFSISRKRARQEVTLILRQWRKYGIRDIQVDKERNIIFARVGPKNYLGMKEVSFAVEIMAVIEHGNPDMLSIARFTQERGAASTMRRLVETMREVFEVRRLLVADKQKAKMMVKTVNA